MKWRTPVIVEIAVGLEINAYACAEIERLFRPADAGRSGEATCWFLRLSSALPRAAGFAQ